MVGIHAMALAVALLPAPREVEFFPGRYYDTRVAPRLERAVLTRWPSPQRLIADGWEGVDPGLRVTWLLGAGFYHDPVVLPAYLEALADPDPRVRLAAAYGLAILIGDDPPAGRRELSPEAARALREEAVALARELRRRPLVRLWLDALLATEGPGEPRVLGPVTRARCLRALDRIVDAGDLAAVVAAYRRAQTREVRRGLLRFVEGLTGRQFLKRPRGPRTGWGEREDLAALAALDRWVGATCVVDEVKALRSSLGALGVRGTDPYGAGACDVWIQVLQRGPDVFRPLASRQLVRCGAPPERISFFYRDDRRAREHRRRLLAFFGYGKVGRARAARGVRPGRGG